MIHGLDVARAVLAVHAHMALAAGQRWLLTDGRVYDWWDLASAWGDSSVLAAPAPGADSDSELALADAPPGPQPVWVRELMAEAGVRALALSKRQIAYLSPRLGVLNNIPFAVPFDVRVGIFRRFVVNDMGARGLSPWRRGGRLGTTRATVRRTHIAQDGFDKLGEADLRAPIAITFVDQFGQEE